MSGSSGLAQQVTAMSIEQIRQTLYESAKLKMPVFRYGIHGEETPTPPREKIEKLEDYLLQTARWRGHLEQCRLYAQDALRRLNRDWAHMAGWEANRREGEKTVASMEDAKRATDPDLYDQIREADALVKDLSAAIRRLEHDDEVASRAYTFITGSS